MHLGHLHGKSDWQANRRRRRETEGDDPPHTPTYKDDSNDLRDDYSDDRSEDEQIWPDLLSTRLILVIWPDLLSTQLVRADLPCVCRGAGSRQTQGSVCEKDKFGV